MPTPAARATASRLASAPPALKTAFAASSTRSRLRTASARGFRVFFSDCLMPIDPLSRGLEKRREPPYIRLRHADTENRRRANGFRSLRPRAIRSLGNAAAPAWTRAGPSAVSLNHGCFGALHEHSDDTDRDRSEATDRARRTSPAPPRRP